MSYLEGLRAIGSAVRSLRSVRVPRYLEAFAFRVIRSVRVPRYKKRSRSALLEAFAFRVVRSVRVPRY